MERSRLTVVLLLVLGAFCMAVGGAIADVRVIEGVLSGVDPTFKRPEPDTPCVVTTNDTHYDVYNVTHTGGPFVAQVYGQDSGMYTLTDGVVALYKAPFNPAMPCDNIRTENGVPIIDDWGLFSTQTLLRDPVAAVQNLPEGSYDIVVFGKSDTDLGTYQVRVFSGMTCTVLAQSAITEVDPTFNQPEYDAGPTCKLSGVVTPYEVYSYDHPGGCLTVFMVGDLNAAVPHSDPLVVIYGGAGFDPGAPCANFEVLNDDYSSWNDSNLNAAAAKELPPGTYDIVATSFNDTHLGDYVLSACWCLPDLQIHAGKPQPVPVLLPVGACVMGLLLTGLGLALIRRRIR